MNLPGHIVLLSGPPGVGKTTIADRLAQLPGVPKAHIHTDDFWGNIKHGHIDPWLPESQAQNQMIMQVAAGVAHTYAQAGFWVVVDGVIGPDWLPVFEPLNAPLHYVVMRTNATEAIERCRARGGDTLTDPVVIADLHQQFADLGPYEPHALRVDGMSVDQACETIRDALSSGRFLHNQAKTAEPEHRATMTERR